MITLLKIAYEAQRIVYGEYIDNSEDQLSKNYVVLLARQALNKLLAPKIFENLNGDDRGTLPLMVVQYTVSVTGESPNKKITLPEFYVNLPFNKGIHGVATVEDPTNFGIPRLNPSVSRNLPCSDLDPGQFSWWTIGYNLYFDEHFEYAKVLLYLLVAAPDTIGESDPLPIFPEMQLDLVNILCEMIRDRKGIQTRLADPNTNVDSTVKR